ncbi:hypothetical protein HPC49_05430 [Pyxidicoccus fallax]|uniref:Uncharacterized protein n=1 Tax=Pyxidicoccus fallax TaxID=394095 RepID=A0A848L7Y8_9BACT|nr:hypothetical protein [Pyxidicoccus fallax]NMO14734.1 hypothetical protein [Pyxidicoccus fallax]NPC77695.1 hypothetical protein [Pyxidicoccus fallax]
MKAAIVVVAIAQLSCTHRAPPEANSDSGFLSGVWKKPKAAVLKQFPGLKLESDGKWCGESEKQRMCVSFDRERLVTLDIEFLVPANLLSQFMSEYGEPDIETGTETMTYRWMDRGLSIELVQASDASTVGGFSSWTRRVSFRRPERGS